MNKNNYHTHTTRCYHASGKDEEYVKAAIKAGIKELGFSDHTPWHYDSSFKASMRMPECQLDDYIESIRYLKEKYKDQISILIGLECEYFERYMPWLEKMLKDKQIDYIILGNHYYETDELHQYFGSPVNEYYLKAYVDHCIKAIDTGLYSYIAHPDLVYYDQDSKLYQEEMSRLCAYAKEKDIVLDEEWVKRGISQSDSNYKYFYFSESGLNITFPPYQVASWADGEITLTIPYEKLEGILKSEYMDDSLVTDITYPKQTERDLSEFEGKKLIAFNFDDGPNTKTTSRLLDGIKEFDARVTFFVLGSRVASNSEVLKRAYVEGNQIGSHTYNHLNLLLLDDANVLSEINMANEEIEKVIGIRPNILRPPYGNINDHIKTYANMHIINWDIDTEDWKLKDCNLIKDKILESAHDGAIVLLHDIYTESVEGALMAMRELERDGYAFVTIEEMVKLKGVTLDYDTTYYYF